MFWETGRELKYQKSNIKNKNGGLIKLSRLAGVNNFKLFAVVSLAFNIKRADRRKLIVSNDGKQRDLNDKLTKPVPRFLRQRVVLRVGGVDKKTRSIIDSNDQAQTNLENF